MSEVPSTRTGGEAQPRLTALCTRRPRSTRAPASPVPSSSNATRHFPYRHDPQRFAAILLDFVQTTTPMPVDEQRWRSRLRAGVQSTAVL